MSDWRILKGKNDFYCSPYNLTWTNERCVELALAFRWLKLNQNIIEIGAVMPYYDANPYTPHIEKIVFNHEVIDPYDEKATIPDFMENHDLSNKKVLAISTIEHIGTTDYEPSKTPLKQNIVDEDAAPSALQQILNQAESCLVTVPVGYNYALDSWLNDNLHRLKCFGYHKTKHGFDLSGETWPPELLVEWEYLPEIQSLENYEYDSPYPSGNFVLCIEGWK